MASLVMVGYFIALVPLAVAVVISVTSLLRLADHSERLVREGVLVTRLGERIRDELFDLERVSRQFVALGDPELLEVFFDRLGNVRRLSDELKAADVGVVNSEILSELRLELVDMSQQWSTGLQTGQPLAESIKRIQLARQKGEELYRVGQLAIDRQVDEVSRERAFIRQLMAVLLLAFLPLSFFILIWIIRLVSRPLRMAQRQIRQIGHGDFDAPITLHYPNEMAELGEQLDWLRIQLREQREDKDRFLRHVTHELKTPVAAISDSLSLFEDGALGEISEAQREIVDIERESVAELGQQIDKLLSYARWRQDVQVTLSDFPVEPWLTKIQQKYTAQMRRRGMRFSTVVTVEQIFGQADRLSEAVDNFVGNAFKHSPDDGAIEIEMHNDNGLQRLSVRDFGEGVPDSEKQRIFEPFERGFAAKEQAVRGTGVGLSIVKDAASAHAGEVYVEDAHPGARFVLIWPDSP